MGGKYYFIFIYCLFNSLLFYRPPREQMEPLIQKEGVLTALPKPPCVIDYFEPAFWNDTIPPRERMAYVHAGIRVALPKKEFCKDWEAIKQWKDLDDDAFMAAYGDAVLREFNIPTEAEIAQYYEASGEEGEVQVQLRVEETEPQVGASGSSTHMQDIE